MTDEPEKPWRPTKTPLFRPGRILFTQGGMDALVANKILPSQIMVRHLTGEWGDLSDDDKKANRAALSPTDPLRILSSHRLGNGDTVWVITEADRSTTTILTPSEY